MSSVEGPPSDAAAANAPRGGATAEQRLLGEIERRLEHYLDPLVTALANRNDYDDTREHLEQLTTAYRRLERGYRELEATNGELAARNEALEAANRELDATNVAITGSRAWRMLSPLRFLLSRLGGASAGVVPPAAPATLVPPQGAGEKPAEPPQLQFPIRGAIAALPEVSGETAEPLDVVVSVIIPTFNAGAEFDWLVRKLKAQRGLRDVEIVVVDSGSSDGTPERAVELGCKLVQIPNERFDHSYARNLGADHASGGLYLFMVQDAYPVGDHWLHSLARALLQPRCEAERLGAVSCAEFPRCDSELFYNLAIDAHYRFVGCVGVDRIGEYRGEDQADLRAQGQLSDVACMIPADTFHAYRYEGRFAEDILLGVRLIRDGHRTGMLASVPVIHSHNRAPLYHLKRNFVDRTFLADAFEGFAPPEPTSMAGLAAASRQLEDQIEAWKPLLGAPAGDVLHEFASKAIYQPRRLSFEFSPAAVMGPALTAWLNDAVELEGGLFPSDAARARRQFADILRDAARFVGGAYGDVDAYLAGELTALARKSLAAMIGGQLATYYLDERDAPTAERRAHAVRLSELLLAGV